MFNELNNSLKDIKKSIDILGSSLRESNYINQGQLNKLPTAHSVIDPKKNFYYRDEEDLYEFRCFALSKVYNHGSYINKTILEQYKELFVASDYLKFIETDVLDSIISNTCPRNINISVYNLCIFRSKKIINNIHYKTLMFFPAFNSVYSYTGYSYASSNLKLGLPFLINSFNYQTIDYIPSWRELLFHYGYFLVE